MATSEQINELIELCRQIGELKPERSHYIKRAEWGEITFESIENEIELVFWLVEQLSQLPMQVILDQDIANAKNELQQINQQFIKIDEFTISSGNAASLRDKITNEFKHQYEQFIRAIGMWIPLLALKAGEFESWTEKMSEFNTRGDKVIEKLLKNAESSREEVESIVQTARVAAGEAGAAEFTHEFRDEAKTADKRGKRWLWPTCVFSIAALSLSFLLIFDKLGETPATMIEAAYGLGGRVFAISVLFYAAIWSGRLVLANLHLASLNRHRAVSLQTLQAFLKAAEDKAAKDAVVLEAARAVYENVPSGYIGHAESGKGSTRLLEIVRGISKSNDN